MGDVATIAGKLKPVLLMLSSQQPGEVANAAAAVTRTLKSAGCDWHDLVAGLTPPPSAKPKFQESAEDRDARVWRKMRDFCLKHEIRLREREFLSSLRKWRGNPTKKQLEWLTAIYKRVGGNYDDMDTDKDQPSGSSRRSDA